MEYKEKDNNEVNRIAQDPPLVNPDERGAVEKIFDKMFIGITEQRIELSQLIKKFDQTNDGQLSPSEFEKMLMQMDPIISKLEIESVFKYFDRDSSGQVNVSEIKAGLEQYSGFFYQKHCVQLSKQLVNKDREISNLNSMLKNKVEEITRIE